jgi:pSer/pThr/pTyr-binding forkhead associated (FHA) protein
MPALIANDGPIAGTRFEIVGADVYVGREGQDITADDPEMSRRHACLRTSGGTVTIEDLGSLNGTYVNGERIDVAAVLSDGDVVRLGKTSFSFEGRESEPTVEHDIRSGVPLEPFGAYAAPTVTVRGRRRGAASRMLVPELVTIVAVVSTAVALALYFGLR